MLWCGFHADIITGDSEEYPTIGGLSNISPQTIKEVTPRLTQALNDLKNRNPNQFVPTLIRIVSGKEQTVAGSRYELVVEFSSAQNQIQQCDVVFWEKPWENFFKIDVKCPDSTLSGTSSPSSSSLSTTQTHIPVQPVYPQNAQVNVHQAPVQPTTVHPAPIQPEPVRTDLVQPESELSKEELFELYQKVISRMEELVKSEPNYKNLSLPYLELIRGTKQQTTTGSQYSIDVSLLDNSKTPCNVNMSESVQGVIISFKLRCKDSPLESVLKL